MARLDGETSNTLADELFETLEDWNTYLKAEKIDLSDFDQCSLEDEIKPRKALAKTRKQLRGPQP